MTMYLSKSGGSDQTLYINMHVTPGTRLSTEYLDKRYINVHALLIYDINKIKDFNCLIDEADCCNLTTGLNDVNFIS